MRNSRTDRLLPLAIPPHGLTDPRLSSLADQHAALEADLRDAGTELDMLERTRQQAVAEDRQAVADAERAGKPIPPDRKVKAHDDKIAVARRRMEALEVAIADQRADFLEALEDVADDLRAAAEERRDEARARRAQAIDELEAAHAEFVGEGSFMRWLEDAVKNGGARWRESDGSRVPALRQPSGEPFAWAEVLAGLRDANVPRESTPAKPGTIGPLHRTQPRFEQRLQRQQDAVADAIATEVAAAGGEGTPPAKVLIGPDPSDGAE